MHFFFFFFKILVKPTIVDKLTVNSAPMDCLWVLQFILFNNFFIKNGPTILFTYLNIIPLQYFQFSVFNFNKISCIQTDASMKKISFFVVSIFLAMLMALLTQVPNPNFLTGSNKIRLFSLPYNFISLWIPCCPCCWPSHFSCCMHGPLLIALSPPSLIKARIMQVRYQLSTIYKGTLSIKCWLLSKSRATCWYFGCCSWCMD